MRSTCLKSHEANESNFHTLLELDLTTDSYKLEQIIFGFHNCCALFALRLKIYGNKG